MMAQYSTIIFLNMKFSVKLHNELSDNTLTHFVILFLDHLISPRFYYIHHYQCLFKLLLGSSFRLNHSGKILCGTHTPLFQGFQILTPFVQFHVWFIVFLPVVFAVIWINQVPIPVKPIFSVWNGFRWTMPDTFGRMADNSFDLADIQYLSSSSREVLSRQSW